MVSDYKNIRPLVIGLGVAGKRHLEAQLNLGIKTGVYTNNPQTLKALKNKTNVIVFDKLQEGIDWSNLVHVCTPDDKHTKFVAMALKKRKAVFCEKAFTTSLLDALYLQNLAHKYSCPLIVAQNYRLTPTFAETKKIIMEGTLGNLTGIRTTYLHDMKQYQKRSPLRKNEDFLFIGGSHAVDLASWIANEQIVSVNATAKKTANEYLSTYQITVKFQSGLLGQITLDANSPQAKNGTDLEATGTEGKLISHNKIDELILKKNGNSKDKVIQLPNINTLTTAVEIKVVDDFLSGKISSHQPLPNADEAVKTIKVLDAIQKAVLSGKEELVSFDK